MTYFYFQRESHGSQRNQYFVQSGPWKHYFRKWENNRISWRKTLAQAMVSFLILVPKTPPAIVLWMLSSILGIPSNLDRESLGALCPEVEQPGAILSKDLQLGRLDNDKGVVKVVPVHRGHLARFQSEVPHPLSWILVDQIRPNKTINLDMRCRYDRNDYNFLKTWQVSPKWQAVAGQEGKQAGLPGPSWSCWSCSMVAFPPGRKLCSPFQHKESKVPGSQHPRESFQGLWTKCKKE